jgi:hypothetical protein
MKRAVLLLLLLWAGTLVVPGFRERVESPLHTAREWGWVQLEGPLSPVTDPYRRMRAMSELNEAARRLTVDRNQGLRAPDPSGFNAYLLRHGVGQDGHDPWGLPYRMDTFADSLSLVSAGPDGAFGTPDDLVVRLRYSHRPARPRPFAR